MRAQQSYRHRCRPGVETLEDRVVPTLFAPLPGTADGAADSLRAALITANGNSQNDVILLRTGTYALTVLNADNATASNLQENLAQTGDLDLTEVNRTIIIQGQGAGKTVIDATGLNDRVLHILSNVRVVLRDLKIRGGVALEQGSPGTPNGAARGGGIFNAGGDLTLERVVVVGNQARGRPDTASSAEGGGIHSTGPLFMSDCTVSNNHATGATGLQGSFSSTIGDFIEVAGGQGLAGGLLVTSNSTAVVQRSTFSGNRAEGGQGGLGGVGQTGFQGGVGGDGAKGGNGRGGGIGVRNGSSLTLINVTVSSNRVTGGLGGAGGPGVNGGGQGNGGDGGDGEGGGLSVDGSTLTLFNSTVAANKTFTQAGGAGAVAGALGLRVGGGLAVIDDNTGTVNSTSSLFGDNIAASGIDVAGILDTANRTLVEKANGLTIANGTANRVGVNPRLGPLAFRGGPTATHSLRAGSAALGRGSNPLGLAFDQRGPNFARSKGPTDIGAFEL
jgi:hypothetical protein